MNDNYDYNLYSNQGQIEVSELSVNKFMAKVFGWMFLGLITTVAAGIAFLIGLFTNPVISSLASSRMFFIGIMIAEFAVVVILSASINKISRAAAVFLFLLYASMTGVTLSYIALLYEITAIGTALLSTIVVFGLMSFIGLVTKADFTSVGKISIIGLIGIIIMSVVNMFLGSGPLDYFICIAGLVVFLGLTAYDAQKIKTRFYNAAVVSGEAMASKLAIIGALELYLDFVNIFLYILRLLGRRK